MTQQMPPAVYAALVRQQRSRVGEFALPRISASDRNIMYATAGATAVAALVFPLKFVLPIGGLILAYEIAAASGLFVAPR